MKPSEHDMTGRVCAQAGFCSVSGGGSLGVRRGRVLARLVGVMAMVGVVFSCFAASALAAEPPQIKPELYNEYVFATRAHIAAEVLTGGVQLEWKGEYATSEKVLEEGKGIAAGGGRLKPNQPVITTRKSGLVSGPAMPRVEKAKQARRSLIFCIISSRIQLTMCVSS